MQASLCPDPPLPPNLNRTVNKHPPETATAGKQLQPQTPAAQTAEYRCRISFFQIGNIGLPVARRVELVEIFGCETGDLLTGNSSLAQDQAQQPAALLEWPDETDRVFIMEVVEKWWDGKPKPDRTRHKKTGSNPACFVLRNKWLERVSICFTKQSAQ